MENEKKGEKERIIDAGLGCTGKTRLYLSHTSQASSQALLCDNLHKVGFCNRAAPDSPLFSAQKITIYNARYSPFNYAFPSQSKHFGLLPQRVFFFCYSDVTWFTNPKRLLMPLHRCLVFLVFGYGSVLPLDASLLGSHIKAMQSIKRLYRTLLLDDHVPTSKGWSSLTQFVVGMRAITIRS